MSTPLIDYVRHGRPLTDVPVFDAHAHIDPISPVLRLPLPEQVEQMKRLGIDRVAVSSSLALGGEVRRGNDNVTAAIRRYPGHILGYCHVSARYPDEIVSELERCFAMDGFRGIKVYQVGVPYDDPLFEPAWAFAKERGVPVLAHTWGGELTGYDHVAEKHPDVAFMAAHTGSGFAYEAYIEAAERCPNLYLDLTYSREHTNMIEHVVERVGADRVVWGTDVPCFSMSHQLSKVLFARITDDDKRKILYHNAAGLFGIEK